MGAISPAESDLSIGQGDQAMIGNCHSVSVAAKISENIFRVAEGPFTVNDPFVAEELTNKCVKGLRVGKMPQLAMKADLMFCESVLQSLPKFPTENDRENLFRQKEAIP